jgi:signal transduction histidine kinase
VTTQSKIFVVVASACLAATLALLGGSRRRGAKLEAERAKELDLVAQRVAHELMSPLTAVSLTLSILLRDHPDEKTAREVQRARRVLDRSRDIVHGIHAFARSAAMPASDATASLRARVLGTTAALRDRQGEACPVVEVQDFEDVDVLMEPAMLDVVLSNLLSNAVTYTATSSVRRITVRARVGARRARVEIEDTGRGVPEGFARTIFEPYRRGPGARKGGLGLGLATVKRLVEGSGGGVGVRNAPSGGAVFWFELTRG